MSKKRLFVTGCRQRRASVTSLPLASQCCTTCCTIGLRAWGLPKLGGSSKMRDFLAIRPNILPWALVLRFTILKVSNLPLMRHQSVQLRAIFHSRQTPWRVVLRHIKIHSAGKPVATLVGHSILLCLVYCVICVKVSVF